MPEPTLIQEQRAILRRLRQTTAHHTQITTAADAQWQGVQRECEELVKASKKVLQCVPTSPPTDSLSADPAEAFRHSASQAVQIAKAFKGLLFQFWQQIVILRVHSKAFRVFFREDDSMVASSEEEEWVTDPSTLLEYIFFIIRDSNAIADIDPQVRIEAIIVGGIYPEIQERAAALAQAMAEAQFWYDRLQEQAAADYRRALQEQIVASYRQWQDSLSRYDQPTPFPWQDSRWQDWAMSTQAEPNLLRLGEMQRLAEQQQLEMPALLAFPISRSLLFKTVAASRATAARAVQSFLLRLLASIPPGKLRFTFIDPVGLGQNAAPFMHLADYDEQLVTGKAWSEPQHIEQRLADLTEHMENVIQQYLRNEYATIEDYNAQAGEIAEPYRVLVVFDFPVNFSETAARRLVSIAQNGPRCGVYAIVLMDTDKVGDVRANNYSPLRSLLADLEQNAEVIAWQDGRWVWQDEDFKECVL